MLLESDAPPETEMQSYKVSKKEGDETKQNPPFSQGSDIQYSQCIRDYC